LATTSEAQLPQLKPQNHPFALLESASQRLSTPVARHATATRKTFNTRAQREPSKLTGHFYLGLSLSAHYKQSYVEWFAEGLS
jgi:hypothetical protein